MSKQQGYDVRGYNTWFVAGPGLLPLHVIRTGTAMHCVCSAQWIIPTLSAGYARSNFCNVLQFCVTLCMKPAETEMCTFIPHTPVQACTHGTFIQHGTRWPGPC